MDTCPGHIGHLAINADDVTASRAFYEAAFGWVFAPHFGQPDFFRVEVDGEDPGPLVVLQGRRDLGATRVFGAEATGPSPTSTPPSLPRSPPGAASSWSR